MKGPWHSLFVHVHNYSPPEQVYVSSILAVFMCDVFASLAHQWSSSNFDLQHTMDPRCPCMCCRPASGEWGVEFLDICYRSVYVDRCRLLKVLLFVLKQSWVQKWWFTSSSSSSLPHSYPGWAERHEDKESKRDQSPKAADGRDEWELPCQGIQWNLP